MGGMGLGMTDGCLILLLITSGSGEMCLNGNRRQSRVPPSAMSKGKTP